MRQTTLLLAIVAALVSAAPAVPAENPKLLATVGPGFSIRLADAAGNAVTQLDPGTYTIVVDDKSNEHNFSLSGPGVSEATEVDFVGTVEWTVTLKDGAYSFFCGPHASFMKGKFTVGAVPATTTPTSSAPKPLVATAGPGYTVALTSGGRKVARLQAGAYAITVRDRSAAHNFRLRGPGMTRATGVAFVGTRVWKVKLVKGRYTYRCDAHKTTMKGSFTVF